LSSSAAPRKAPLRPSGGRGRGPSRRRREGEVGSGQALWNPPTHPGPLRPQGRRGSLVGAVAGRRIGLPGGALNPAHGGHLHISREALKRLDLDEIWWLVSPQNPLKPVAGMAPFAERLQQAAAVAAAARRIRVSDIEAALGTTYTADTLRALRRRFPRARFVWLMGGDNLAQFPYWRGWQQIFRTLPVAVFARPTTSLKALAGKAEDIVTIDLAGKTTFADYMVVASGRSARQVVSLTEHLEKDLPGHVAVEGKSQGDWVLIDAGDVIVHIFRPEIRAYYNLEK